jgi:hypothetical protein
VRAAGLASLSATHDPDSQGAGRSPGAEILMRVERDPRTLAPSGSTRHTATQRAAPGEVIHSGGIVGRNVGHVPPGVADLRWQAGVGG